MVAPAEKETRGKSVSCAVSVAMMCAMQRRNMDMMCYYDARIGTSVYGGLFNPLTFEPFCTYYGFKAFGELYTMGTEIACETDNPAVYALAATDGKKNNILIANTGEDTWVDCKFAGTPVAYLIDEDHMMEKVEIGPDGFTMKQNQVIYIEEA